jgi:hypothetical protein
LLKTLSIILVLAVAVLGAERVPPPMVITIVYLWFLQSLRQYQPPNRNLWPEPDPNTHARERKPEVSPLWDRELDG